MAKTNPRYSNGNLRRKYRARFKAMAAPCGICHGRFGEIHYDEPSDAKHPLSFVIDEIHPVSRWKEFGYSSAREAAEDWSNLQPAHYLCNAVKSNRAPEERAQRPRLFVSDGAW
jgi:5-methylcytosine-specific restriction endonuclease McrA